MEKLDTQYDSRVLNGAAVRLTTLQATLSVGSRQTWKLPISVSVQPSSNDTANEARTPCDW